MNDLIAQIPPFPLALSAGHLAYLICALTLLCLIQGLLIRRNNKRILRAVAQNSALAQRVGMLESAQNRQAMREIYDKHGRPIPVERDGDASAAGAPQV